MRSKRLGVYFAFEATAASGVSGLKLQPIGSHLSAAVASADPTHARVRNLRSEPNHQESSKPPAGQVNESHGDNYTLKDAQASYHNG